MHRVILWRSNKAVRSYDPDTVFDMCTLWHWPWIYDIVSRSWHTLCSLTIDNKCVKYYPDPTLQWWVMTRTRIFRICILCHWPWRYHDTPYSHGKQLCEILSSIYYEDQTRQWGAIAWTPIVNDYCDLDLRDMSLSQVHGTPLGYGH